MRKIFLILSVVIICLWLTGCQFFKTAEPYPGEPLTIIDIANKVCRDYKLVDSENLIFEGPTFRYPIEDVKCEGIIGYRPSSYKKVQNWSRDIQKDFGMQNPKSVTVKFNKTWEKRLVEKEMRKKLVEEECIGANCEAGHE